jgi:hypothetical protein
VGRVWKIFSIGSFLEVLCRYGIERRKESQINISKYVRNYRLEAGWAQMAHFNNLMALQNFENTL